MTNLSYHIISIYVEVIVSVFNFLRSLKQQAIKSCSNFYWKANNHIFERFFHFLLKRFIKNDCTPNDYTCFNTTNEITEWGKKYFLYFEKKENESKKISATEDYSPYKVFQWYAGYYFENVNGILRGTNEHRILMIKEYVLKHIQTINEELEGFKLEKNLIVFRRIPNSLFNDMCQKSKRVGKKIDLRDKGFMSTSLNLNYRINKEGQVSDLRNETFMVIKVPKGVKAIYLEPVSKREEYELLLESNLNITIERAYSLFGNKIVLAKANLSA